MSNLSLEAFDKAPLQHDPCDFVMVPEIVRPEMIDAVNQDYPQIDEPGNFKPDDLSYGPAFASMLEELYSPVLKQKYIEKFGLDISDNPLQITIRKYSELSDGNAHNYSKGKIITTLIYFNDEWKDDAGRLRLLCSSWDINDYSAEVVPEKGTLIAFRRSERSFHGFKRFEGERRSLQMYYVKPKREHKDDDERLTIKRRPKRLFKHRPRFEQGTPYHRQQ